MSAIIFDIETEPLEWSQLEPFFEPLEPLAPWCDSMVKYGNAKDPAIRKEKYAKVRGDYEAKAAAWQSDAEAKKADFIANAAKKPHLARILSIGYATAEGRTIIGGTEPDDSEESQVRRFWELYRKDTTRRWVGFNIHHYDVPLLVYRSWALDIPVPESVFNGGGRYVSDRFVDLMKVWTCGRPGEFVKLDRLARFYSIGGKPDGVDGGAFAGLWNNPETRDQAVAYLENDLQMTLSLAQRLGVV